jgi:pimeloyl-ACP methyl ester carboxylesterase
MIADVPAAQRDTPAGRRELKVTGMMLVEPHIELTALEAITAPTLVLASDHDAIVDEHTVDIFHHLPNGQLAIFPNATHTVPYDAPELFNAAVERFLRATFVKKDRVADLLKSLDKLRGSTEPRQ